MEKWPEIEKAEAEKRRELVLQGPAIDQRISSNGGLTPSIYSLTLLNYLEVSQCPSLTEVHDGIEHLTNLQSLVLCRNKLASIPDVFGSLKSLKVLDLSVNNLRVLPASISALGELNTLNVSCNSLEVLPEGLNRCTKLSTINISKNHITSFPADFCSERLDRLSTLVASDNAIEELSGDVHKLAALKVGRASSVVPQQLNYIVDELSICYCFIKLAFLNRGWYRLYLSYAAADSPDSFICPSRCLISPTTSSERSPPIWATALSSKKSTSKVTSWTTSAWRKWSTAVRPNPSSTISEAKEKRDRERIEVKLTVDAMQTGRRGSSRGRGRRKVLMNRMK